MAGSVNKAIIVGNLGKDVTTRFTQDNKKVVSFSVATSDTWKDKVSGERKENTQWHNVVIFSEGLANIAEQYLRKGSKVFLEGSIQTRKWEKDGIDRYSTEIVLQGFDAKLVMLDGKSSGDNNSASTGGGGDDGFIPPQDGGGLDDAIPFLTNKGVL